MENPRFYFRVNGAVPSDHSLLGYRIPFEYKAINDLVVKFTEGLNWNTIQIKIVPSLTMDKTKVIIISNEFKHMDAPIEHSVVLMDDKSRELIASAETLESLFDELAIQ